MGDKKEEIGRDFPSVGESTRYKNKYRKKHKLRRIAESRKNIEAVKELERELRAEKGMRVITPAMRGRPGQPGRKYIF